MINIFDAAATISVWNNYFGRGNRRARFLFDGVLTVDVSLVNLFF